MMRNTQRSSTLSLPRRGTATIPRHIQPRASIVPPQLSGILARAALLALVATAAFGTLGAAAFIASAGVLMMLAPQSTGRDLVRFWPLLLLPILAMLSTVWSDAPERSLRAALQLFLTFVAAIVICRRIGGGSMILTLFLGYLFLCLLLMTGVPDALAQHTPLYSPLLGSKNQVAFAAHTLIALALTVAVDRRQPMTARLVTGPAILYALLLLVLAQSAGAQTSLAITLITFPAFMVFGRVKMSMRVVILFLVMIAAGIALVLLPDLQAAWSDFRVNVLKKDATLTGRTYLWDFAARLNAERPWLGGGYYAFWRHGNVDAEGLWRWGGIASRNGFNFHNAYLEMQVDLGWVGAGLFIATCAVVAALGFARQLFKPSAPSAFLLSFLIVLYLRGYAESVLIAPFSLLTLLWIASAVYAVDGMLAEDQDTEAKGGERGRSGWMAPRSEERARRRPQSA